MKKFIRSIAKRMKKNESLTGLASFLHRKKYHRRKELITLLPLVLIVCALVLASIISTINRVSPEPTVPEEISDVPQVIRHPLTGAVLETSLERLPQVFGVMVENSSEAWPLVGLDQAFLVIEAPVEGSIPRFIVFSSEEDGITKLGPVRSARAYYLDWNDEFDAVYGHVGGSPEALDLINNHYDTIDFDQFFHAGSYWRQVTGGRFAPHNVYTSSRLLVSGLEKLALDAPVYDAFRFKDPNPRGTTSLSIDFASGVTYDMDWIYAEETNRYTRLQAGRVFKMEDGATIQADNVAVMATDISTYDAKGRKKIVTVGEGDALVAQDGVVIRARWKKEARTSRLRFYTLEGEEIALNSGKTWVEVVANIAQAREVITE